MGLGKRRILIAGVGNELRGDDGLGPRVLEELSKHSLPHDVDVIDFGERLYDLLLKLKGYETAIVVDALDVGGEPGQLYVIEPNPRSDHVEGLMSLNLHEADLKGLMALGRELDMVPERIHVVGCQPEDTSPGIGLSDVVRSKVEDVVRLVESILKDYI